MLINDKQMTNNDKWLISSSKQSLELTTKCRLLKNYPDAEPWIVEN